MILHNGSEEERRDEVSDMYMICDHKESEHEMDTETDAKMTDSQPDDTVPKHDTNSVNVAQDNSNSSFLRQILTGHGYRNDFLALGEIMKVQQLMNSSLNNCISSSAHQNGFSVLAALVPSQEQIMDSRFTIQQVEKFKKAKYRHSVDDWNAFDRFGE